MADEKFEKEKMLMKIEVKEDQCLYSPRLMIKEEEVFQELPSDFQDQ